MYEYICLGKNQEIFKQINIFVFEFGSSIKHCFCLSTFDATSCRYPENN